MAERFTQFEGLVDNCEFGGSEKPVTCIDLQGFWDMIYFQVCICLYVDCFWQWNILILTNDAIKINKLILSN